MPLPRMHVNARFRYLMVAMSPDCQAAVAMTRSLGEARENASDYVREDSGAVVYLFDTEAPSAEPEKWTQENQGTYSAETVDKLFPRREVPPLVFLADHKP